METLVSVSLILIDSLSEMLSINRASSSSVMGWAMVKEGQSFSDGTSAVRIVGRVAVFMAGVMDALETCCADADD